MSDLDKLYKNCFFGYMQVMVEDFRLAISALKLLDESGTDKTAYAIREELGSVGEIGVRRVSTND